MLVRYPRFIHAEFMTHRVFSRNASSSRAIPVAKMIEQVRTDPAMPIHWGKNQPGMQAREELTGQDLEDVQDAWTRAAWLASNIAEEMAAAGAHKQVVNRILEPFQWVHVIVTATEWTNFFELRCHPDADPNMRALADAMFAVKAASKPVYRSRSRLEVDAWHLPFITAEERVLCDDPKFLARISAARCARVSYLNHDGTSPSIPKDIELYEKLVGSRPLHASPVEHQGYPLPLATQWSKNLRGWRQHRELVEQEMA
jgi:thymidylate synthase ThyX